MSEGRKDKTTMTEAERRAARLAAQLKANLQRRKQQVRARRAGEAEAGEGLPAADSGDGRSDE